MLGLTVGFSVLSARRELFSPRLDGSSSCYFRLRSAGKLRCNWVMQASSKRKIAYLKVAEFLVRQHFTVAIADKLEEGAPVIRATAGVCRILVAKSASAGSDRDRIRSYATAADDVFVVFGGRIYAEQPTWLTTFDSLWSKFRRELGLKARAHACFCCHSDEEL